MYDANSPFGSESLPEGYGGTYGTAQQGQIWSENTPMRRGDPNMPAGAAPVQQWQAPWDYPNNPNAAGLNNGGALGAPRQDTYWTGGVVRSAQDAKRVVAQAFVMDGQDGRGPMQWSSNSVPSVLQQGKGMVRSSQSKNLITQAAYEYAVNVEGWQPRSNQATPTAAVAAQQSSGGGRLADILRAVGAGIGSGVAASRGGQAPAGAQATLTPDGLDLTFMDSGQASSPMLPATEQKKVPWGLIAAGVGVLVVGGIAFFALSKSKPKSNPKKATAFSFLKKFTPKRRRKSRKRKK
jgi:hypothetical protein